MTAPVILPNLLSLTAEALPAAEAICEAARMRLRDMVSADGKVQNALIEDHQTAAHGFAWLATYVQSLQQMQIWAEALQSQQKFGETEQLIHQIAFGEYLCQLTGGIPMNQTEVVRLQDLGLPAEAAAPLTTGAAAQLASDGNTQAARLRLVTLMQEFEANTILEASGLDEELEMIREQFRRYAVEKVEPFAHEWHLKDELIPMEVIDELAEMGVFGLTIPEEYGGFGLSKAAMCVVSEELSRGYIGVGSLGTRSEIAAELIIAGGTEAQKEKWLPALASGEKLPTAVFTEPNTGSDLGALRTRAVKSGDDWSVTGNKTWITHATRTHVMTLLARTDPDTTDYKGLSMFLAEKTPGSEEVPFPSDGMTGGEIEVLGYRGMKEYDIAFDGFAVPEDAVLGGETGKGFKQLMQTFESARIQTAARAIGVAQNALELGFAYARDRAQFGKSIYQFERVSGKLVMMAAEILAARQLAYFAARTKDADKRCDLEAGMAKLLAARVAWAAADNALQVHGGNGFAMEYPVSRILCDARILNIFEGAAEIQADIIARRLPQKT